MLKNFFSILLQKYFKTSYDYMKCEERLTRFLMKINEPKLSELVHNCGFDLLDTRSKLKILRLLLEAQLHHNSNNKKIKYFIASAKSNQLRKLPLGRDVNGNWYWKFETDNNSSIIIKELVDEDSEPYFEHVRGVRQVKSLVTAISNTSSTKYCDGFQCKVRKYVKIDVVGCTKCKSSWHFRCISDTALHFDQEGWQCPHCDQFDLLANLNGLFREE